jgi:hypothetical protein
MPQNVDRRHWGWLHSMTVSPSLREKGFVPTRYLQPNSGIWHSNSLISSVGSTLDDGATISGDAPSKRGAAIWPSVTTAI